MLKSRFLRALRPQCYFQNLFSFSQKEVYDLRKPDKTNKKYLMDSTATRTMIIHPIFYPKLNFFFFFPSKQNIQKAMVLSRSYI